jgi:hypothetical protein
MTPEMELGAWIIAAYKAISKYDLDLAVLDPYEAIITGGKAADLFSATRSLGMIDGDRFDRHRKLAKLKPTPAREVLRLAERLGFVDVAWSKDASRPIDTFRFRTDSKEAVLEATGSIFPELEPTNIARATVDLLGLTLRIPDRTDLLLAQLTAKGYTQEDVEATIRLATAVGLLAQTRETERGEEIIFNPYAFESNAEDAFDALDHLGPSERQLALDILDHVCRNPGIPSFPKGTDKQTVSLLIKVGLIDYSKITTTSSKRGAYFPTTPHIWGVFDKAAGGNVSTDLIDDAKLFFNSLRYGQYFSHPQRGRIKNPAWIVNTLLSQGAVGVVRPATAIGEDYPLALSRGIVNVVESRLYPGRYSMELLKRDVVAAVSEVLEHQTILPQGKIPTEEEVERAGQFISPAAIRIETKLPDSLKELYDELIFGLRTTRKRRH